MVIIIGGYFGLNMLQNMISSTGANEVAFNGITIFSKLASQRLPLAE